MKNIILSLDPFLARKVQVVAMRYGITFADALFFLIHSVITPREPATKSFAEETGLIHDLII